MDEKRNAILTVAIICAMLLVFTAADLFNGDRIYSETENRVLASRPELSQESVKSGEFGAAYEEYITDQFVGRDKWIGIKTASDILMQKKDINGVYLGQDGYLIEQHLPSAYESVQVTKRTALLEKLVHDWNAKVMLVPTADNVLTDKLPANAAYYDQEALLAYVEEQIGESHYIDVFSVLKEHSQEEIYYRTDHHWTSLGAYYGYSAWAQALGVRPYDYSVSRMRTASEDFLGTLHSRLNLPMKGDEITYFPETIKRPVTVTYDFEETMDTYYQESYLETKNKYGFFLDDNHAFTEIHTSYRNGKTLFVIKDSYANSLIPLLTPHYQTIYVVDLRYLNGSLYEFMQTYEPEGGMDVLVVYNCIHFLEDFQYYE